MVFLHKFSFGFAYWTYPLSVDIAHNSAIFGGNRQRAIMWNHMRIYLTTTKCQPRFTRTNDIEIKPYGSNSALRRSLPSRSTVFFFSSKATFPDPAWNQPAAFQLQSVPVQKVAVWTLHESHSRRMTAASMLYCRHRSPKARRFVEFNSLSHCTDAPIDGGHNHVDWRNIGNGCRHKNTLWSGRCYRGQRNPISW